MKPLPKTLAFFALTSTFWYSLPSQKYQIIHKNLAKTTIKENLESLILKNNLEKHPLKYPEKLYYPDKPNYLAEKPNPESNYNPNYK